jgi:hypothetical protein
VNSVRFEVAADHRGLLLVRGLSQLDDVVVQ